MSIASILILTISCVTLWATSGRDIFLLITIAALLILTLGPRIEWSPKR